MNSKRRGRKKWTNEFVTETMIGRNITCTTDLTFIDQPSITPVEWKCGTCNHEWKARLDNIVGKQSGCPKCAGNLEYTLESYKARLTSLNRTDIEVHALESRTSQHSQRMGHFTCNTCSHAWKASIHNVVKFGYGCPECNGNMSKPITDSLGNRFHSRLEYYFWIEYHKRGVKFPLVRQQKYTQERRFTCDFALPTNKMWVEVSGTQMLKREKYASTIAWKRQAVLNRQETFVILTSHTEIDQFITSLLKDQTNV